MAPGPSARRSHRSGRARRTVSHRRHGGPGKAIRRRRRSRTEVASTGNGETPVAASGRAAGRRRRRACHGNLSCARVDRHRRISPIRLSNARRTLAVGVEHARSMIGRLSGVLLEKSPPQLLLDVQGVAYEVNVPMSTFYNLPATGERVTLFTHLVVREDAHLLYGFGSDNERRGFRQLVKVNGIGAKIALAVLSGLSVTELAQAITLQESGRLTKIPGIGKKTAERILLELKDTLGADLTAAIDMHRPAPVASDILHALLSLGYSDREAANVVKQLPDGLAVGDGIRQALKLLAKA